MTMRRRDGDKLWPRRSKKHKKRGRRDLDDGIRGGIFYPTEGSATLILKKRKADGTCWSLAGGREKEPLGVWKSAPPASKKPERCLSRKRNEKKGKLAV